VFQICFDEAKEIGDHQKAMQISGLPKDDIEMTQKSELFKDDKGSRNKLQLPKGDTEAMQKSRLSKGGMSPERQVKSPPVFSKKTRAETTGVGDNLKKTMLSGSRLTLVVSILHYINFLSYG